MSEEIRKNSDCLNRRLLAYTTAAGAALVAGGAAEAGVFHSGAVNQAFGDGNPFDLNMQGGSAEAQFNGGPGDAGYAFSAQSLDNDFQVNAVDGTFPLVAKMTTAEYVGPDANIPNNTFGLFLGFKSTYTSCPIYITTLHGTITHWTYTYTNKTFGEWASNEDIGYFGFSFSDNGTTLYGWGQVERTSSTSGVLIDWAYEDSGDPIRVGDTGAAVPEPGSLALLALGAAGIASMRRKRHES